MYVTRTTERGNIDYIEVRIAVDRLMKSDTSGTFNHTVKFDIEYKESTASAWIAPYGGTISISGKTTSRYIKEFRFRVPRIEETKRYDIRVRKVTADSSETLFSDLTWDSFQEIISDNPTYPNTATVHFVAPSSDQFSSLPDFKGDYLAMIVSVPSNYDPVNKVYYGMWMEPLSKLGQITRLGFFTIL